MPGYMDVGAAIEVAKKHLEQRRRVLELIETVRSDLRNAVDRKEATPEQVKWIGEQFPMRERKRMTPAEKVRAAREAVKAAEAEAAKSNQPTPTTVTP